MPTAAPTPTGSAGTRLIIVRAVRDRYSHHNGYGCALVEQDHLRRILLRDATNPAGSHHG